MGRPVPLPEQGPCSHGLRQERPYHLRRIQRGNPHGSPGGDMPDREQKADEIIGTIRELLPSFKMKVFDEDTGYGFLRHVLVRTAHATGEIMVVLITASPGVPVEEQLREGAPKGSPGDHDRGAERKWPRHQHGPREKEHVLYGPGFIVDVLSCGKKFRISSKILLPDQPGSDGEALQSGDRGSGTHRKRDRC